MCWVKGEGQRERTSTRGRSMQRQTIHTTPSQDGSVFSLIRALNCGTFGQLSRSTYRCWTTQRACRKVPDTFRTSMCQSEPPLAAGPAVLYEGISHLDSREPCIMLACNKSMHTFNQINCSRRALRGHLGVSEYRGHMACRPRPVSAKRGRRRHSLQERLLTALVPLITTGCHLMRRRWCDEENAPAAETPLTCAPWRIGKNPQPYSIEFSHAAGAPAQISGRLPVSPKTMRRGRGAG